MKLIPALLVLILQLYGRGYTTNFRASENPLSEDGAWINGATTGLDWCDVQTSPGLAWGVGPCPVEYADPTAILKG